ARPVGVEACVRDAQDHVSGCGESGVALAAALERAMVTVVEEGVEFDDHPSVSEEEIDLESLNFGVGLDVRQVELHAPLEELGLEVRPQHQTVAQMLAEQIAQDAS